MVGCMDEMMFEVTSCGCSFSCLDSFSSACSFASWLSVFFKGECSPHMNSVVRGEIHEIIYAAKGTNKAKINPLSLVFILMSYCTPCACNLRLHERILDVLSYSQV